MRSVFSQKCITRESIVQENVHNITFSIDEPRARLVQSTGELTLSSLSHTRKL
ncbi:hypothetical protein Bealeia2_01911 (plasmid) [Candidatus Bealeia paramacronuclearis]|nr:hypothetical protein [Candidatus Bealeia paramacronuclearis]